MVSERHVYHALVELETADNSFTAILTYEEKLLDDGYQVMELVESDFVVTHKTVQ